MRRASGEPGGIRKGGISLPLAAMALFAAVTLALSLWGGVQGYSSTPRGDMWTGTLEFLFRQGRDSPAIWWELHNEHRILLSRLLFWADSHWFGDDAVFLTAMNYLLAAAGAAIAWLCLRWRLREAKLAPSGANVMGLFLTAWLFLWMQHQNLTWAFQSQFFLVFLVPFLASAFLARAADATLSPSGRLRCFLAALLLGIASVGTMANGLLALPVLTLQALAARQGWRRVTVLAAVSLLCFAAYLWDFESPERHEHSLERLLDETGTHLAFFFAYLGNPFFWLAGEGKPGGAASILAGLAFVLLWVLGCLLAVRRRDPAPMAAAMLCFAAYIAASAAITAYGRGFIGLSYAASSRYATPALLGWAALLIFYSPWLLRAFGSRIRPLLLLSAGLLCGTMLVSQAKVFSYDRGITDDARFGALAAELGAYDEAALSGAFNEFPEEVARAANLVRGARLSVFGRPPLAGLREQLGQAAAAAGGSSPCRAEIASITPLAGEGGFLRVVGSIEAGSGGDGPNRLRFLDADGVTLGFALTGRPSEKKAAELGMVSLVDGEGEIFLGYLAGNDAGSLAKIWREKDDCLALLR